VSKQVALLKMVPTMVAIDFYLKSTTPLGQGERALVPTIRYKEAIKRGVNWFLEI